MLCSERTRTETLPPVQAWFVSFCRFSVTLAINTQLRIAFCFSTTSVTNIIIILLFWSPIFVLLFVSKYNVSFTFISTFSNELDKYSWMGIYFGEWI